MGRFKDWLMQKVKDNPYDDLLPEPTRPAPPMPECKPPKKDISEPVIMLLEMLDRDEWELQYTRETYSIVNVLDESLIFGVDLRESYRHKHYTLYDYMWMTNAECIAVAQAVERVWERLNKLNSAKQRKAFATKLGVQNELV